MARDAYISTNRYAARMRGSHLGSVFTEKYASMVTNFATYMGEMCAIVDATKAILNTDGILINQYPFYLVYARELYRMTKNFSGPSLWYAILALRNKWISWGLAATTLQKIERDVFGIVPTPPPSQP